MQLHPGIQRWNRGNLPLTEYTENSTDISSDMPAQWNRKPRKLVTTLSGLRSVIVHLAPRIRQRSAVNSGVIYSFTRIRLI